ncbi:MAG: hypothetical protein WCA46_20270 [Actinocatenispora sp.]
MNRLDSILLRLAVALRPKETRDRWREQWHADLAGAADLGLDPRRVAYGALRSSLSAPRRARPAVAHGSGRVVKLVAVAVGVLLVGVFAPLGIMLAPVLVLAGCAVLCARAALAGRRRLAWALAAAGSLWPACSVAAWWLWGLGFDRADAGRSPSRVLDLGMQGAFLAAIVAFGTLVVLVVVTLVRLGQSASTSHRGR